MATFGEVKSRVINELDRTDLASVAPDAVRLTIKRYEAERLHFTVSRNLTLNTVAGQVLYTGSDASWIPDIVRIDNPGFVLVGGQNRKVYRDDPVVLEFMTDNSATQGEPLNWAYYAQQLRLYPVPDQVYSLRFHGVMRLAALSADGDTNAWTTDAEDLITAGAKRWICQQVTKDFQLAEVMKMAEDEALQRLRSEYTDRHATGKITATQF